MAHLNNMPFVLPIIANKQGQFRYSKKIAILDF